MNAISPQIVALLDWRRQVCEMYRRLRMLHPDDPGGDMAFVPFGRVQLPVGALDVRIAGGERSFPPTDGAKR